VREETGAINHHVPYCVDVCLPIVNKVTSPSTILKNFRHASDEHGTAMCSRRSKPCPHKSQAKRHHRAASSARPIQMAHPLCGHSLRVSDCCMHTPRHICAEVYSWDTIKLRYSKYIYFPAEPCCPFERVHAVVTELTAPQPST
jgi:hypothetical protein